MLARMHPLVCTPTPTPHTHTLTYTHTHPSPHTHVYVCTCMFAQTRLIAAVKMTAHLGQHSVKATLEVA